MCDKIFITGATGFLGRNLLKSLLDKYSQSIFYVLVRSEVAKNKLEERFGRSYSERICYVYGDLTLPEYNIASECMRQIIPNIIQFWHVAASTSFDDRKRNEIIKTNIEGVKGIISLAKKSKALDCLYFVSTAYIAGNNQGIVYEDVLPDNIGFKNCYEESKYHSEQLVKESGLPYAIFRPSIIMGDSVTADSQQETRMMYGYVLGVYYSIASLYKNKKEFIENWVNNVCQHIPLRLIVERTATKNYVCIDDVVNMILAIIMTDHVNKTFNLTNQMNLYAGDIVDVIGKVLKVDGLSCNGGDIDNPNKTEKLIARQTKPFHKYTLYPDPIWDTTNTEKALGDYKRVEMTLELFTFLLNEFIKSEITN